jgi:hypothetical protein
MKENNIILFPMDRMKPKDSEKDADSEVRIVKELTPEEEKNFVLKCAWVVETLYALKQSDSHAIKKDNVQIRRELVRGSSPEFLQNIIMGTDELKINKDPSYYEAVTDEIYERKLNRPRK